MCSTCVGGEEAAEWKQRGGSREEEAEEEAEQRKQKRGSGGEEREKGGEEGPSHKPESLAPLALFRELNNRFPGRSHINTLMLSMSNEQPLSLVSQR